MGIEKTFTVFGLECWDKYDEPKRTLADMQRDMEKLNADIAKLREMDLEDMIKLLAVSELKRKKKELLAEMHKELDKMYYRQ